MAPGIAAQKAAMDCVAVSRVSHLSTKEHPEMEENQAGLESDWESTTSTICCLHGQSKQLPEMQESPFLRDGTVPLPPRSSFTEKTWGTVFRLCQKEKKNGRGFLRRKLPSSNINSTSSLSCDQKRSKIESHCLQGCFIYVTGLSGVGSVTVCLWVFKLKNHLWDYFRRTAGLFTDAIHFLSGSSLDLNFALLLFSRYLGTDRFSSSWTRRSKLLK